MWLEQINHTNDIKRLPQEALPALAAEIRSFLVTHLSETGGHLGANLGAVELTIALHRMLNLPEDKIVWDVGHQSYTHKILTGRKEGFAKLRQSGGLSGFPKRSESDTDVFETGHASNSISAGLGMVVARELAGQTHTVVSVIGDGALSGGEAYEAINNASKLDSNFIIVLNDNNMSISEPTGGISKYLNSIRTMPGYLNLRDNVYHSLAGRRQNRMIEGVRRAKNSVKQLFVPGMFFEQLDATYLGPVDGHDIEALCRAVKEAKNVRKAVVLHVITKKGKGYAPAENHPAKFHGTDPFHIENGVPIRRKKAAYQDIFSTVMIKLAARDQKVVAITAAMAEGTGLKRFRNIYPDRFFDVGIAEPHAVTFAAGLATGGYKPVVAIYSTFLQRAYDQVMIDVCMQNLPVVFAIDRAGIVGADGETHQGMFDLSYLSTIPNLTILSPKNKWELSDMLKYAIALEKPVAIRYPRGEAWDGLSEHRAPVETGKAEVIYEEQDILLFAIGSMVKCAEQVREQIKEAGYSCSLVNARFVKPFDRAYLEEAVKTHRYIAVLEENTATGGLGEQVKAYLDDVTREQKAKERVTVQSFALPDAFVEHGKPDELLQKAHLDPDSIAAAVLETVKRNG